MVSKRWQQQLQGYRSRAAQHWQRLLIDVCRRVPERETLKHFYSSIHMACRTSPFHLLRLSYYLQQSNILYGKLHWHSTSTTCMAS